MNVKTKMMNTEIPYDLLAKYLSGQCNEAEKEELEKWKNSGSANELEFNHMKKAWEETSRLSYPIDVESALSNVSVKIDSLPERKPVFLSTWTRIAAVFIIGLGCFSLYYYLFRGNSSKMLVAENNSSAPISISLSDGSTVVLKTNSVLTYPKKFTKEEKKILFTGEAYFEIARDEKKPFIIESGKAITRVLGTRFNLKANHADTSFTIIVTEGIVSFGLVNNTVQVKEGEAGKINIAEDRVTRYLNTDLNFLAWKTGLLTFENCRLDKAVETLSAYYNQSFIIDNPSLDSLKFSLVIDSLPINDALTSMSMVLVDVKIVKENGIYYLR